LDSQSHETLGKTVHEISKFPVGEAKIAVRVDHGVVVRVGGDGPVQDLTERQRKQFGFVHGHLACWPAWHGKIQPPHLVDTAVYTACRGGMLRSTTALLVGEIEYRVNFRLAVASTTDMVGNNRVVINAVPRLEDMGVFPVSHFDFPRQDYNELFSFMGGKLLFSGGFRQNLHKKGSMCRSLFPRPRE